MTAPRQKCQRQPLEEFQVMHSHPFEHITIDFLGGDLPQTRKGNKYLLTVICNVSLWVHAIPMRNLKAETIAEGLIEFFSWTGIPKTITCDNMASFRSEIFSALREKLGIEANFSSPWHYISHGKIERTNRTLEQMLRRFILDYPHTWDQLMKYFLLALREAPSEATKFSPSELVFGRKMRGLLAVARETWTRGDPIQRKLKVSTIKYVEDLNQRIASALKAAKANQQTAQKKMKRLYDTESTIRELSPGELALVLLPTVGNKLFAKWQGPFQVIEKGTNNNYKLDVAGRTGVFHINSLRKYCERDHDDAVAEVNMIITDSHADDLTAPTDDNSRAPPRDGDATAEFQLAQQLTAEQRDRLQQLLERYGDVFSDTPGTTYLMEHEIKVTDQIPCFQAS